MKKLKTSQLVKAYSQLSKVANSKGSKRTNLLNQKNNNFLDIVCHCVSNGITNLPKTVFKKEDWKNLKINAESLRFLSDYINCNHKRKKSLRKQRKKIIQQSGGSISIILGILLPMLVDIIVNKFT